jgi:hemerythrin-like domain-containing protein
MELQRQISRKLHEEHITILALLDRFGQALLRPRAQPTEHGDPVWRQLLAQLESALQYEVTSHFGLEEDQLFPRLHQRGEGDLAELLFEEHEAIREVTRPLLDLLARSRSGEFNEGDWRSLKASGLELVERLGAHARKEELALVPLVDEMLDEQSDNALWDEYGAG